MASWSPQDPYKIIYLSNYWIDLYFLCLCLNPRWMIGWLQDQSTNELCNFLVFPLICFDYDWYRTPADCIRHKWLCSSVGVCCVSICCLCFWTSAQGTSGVKSPSSSTHSKPQQQDQLPVSLYLPPFLTPTHRAPPVSMCEQRNNSTAVLRWNMKPSLVPQRL